MSHKAIVISPAGTLLGVRTVGELVGEQPGRCRIFQKDLHAAKKRNFSNEAISSH